MVSETAVAQDSYPSRPTRIVVPYTPGGNADLVARLYAKELGDALGQPFQIDNRPGGATNIGAEAVARSAPDGYTLFLLQGTSHGINPSLYPKLPYDPIKDFSAVGLIANTTFFLVVNANLPVTNVRELVAYARANPNKLSYGSPGNASPTHLAGEVLNRRAEMGLQHVPYKGDAPAIVDLMADRVLFMFSATALSFVKQGKLKALAVADTKRWPLEPDIPSMREAGYPDFEFLSYFGLAVPAATPEAIQERLNQAMTAIARREDVRARIAALGLVPLGGTRAESNAYVAREIEKWRPIVRNAGAKLE
ncbi:MAG: tripartite tricarboxylate transporter substrate binding protein [Burkholderiales bacterium]|nr:tripartite tricarboxylate transporter substrate binding protein [Burkholderiales bacterium]